MGECWTVMCGKWLVIHVVAVSGWLMVGDVGEG